MQTYLAENGIKAVPKLIIKGSMKGCWRLYAKNGKRNPENVMDNYAKWNTGLCARLSELGFKDFDNKPLSQDSGNGGVFHIFARHPMTLDLFKECYPTYK